MGSRSSLHPSTTSQIHSEIPLVARSKASKGSERAVVRREAAEGGHLEVVELLVGCKARSFRLGLPI